MTLAPFVDSGMSAKSDAPHDDDEQCGDGVDCRRREQPRRERCEPDDRETRSEQEREAVSRRPTLHGQRDAGGGDEAAADQPASAPSGEAAAPRGRGSRG